MCVNNNLLFSVQDRPDEREGQVKKLVFQN